MAVDADVAKGAFVPNVVGVLGVVEVELDACVSVVEIDTTLDVGVVLVVLGLVL